MSGLAARLGSVARPLPAVDAGETRTERDSVVIRLAAFLGLAAYGSAHWALLVDNADEGRILAQVAIATAGAGALALLPALGLRTAARSALAATLALATLAAGLVAAGLEGRYLRPEHWDDLGDGLDRGLSGVFSISWPYAGPDEWIRLTVLLGAPLLLALAAALAFWPAARWAGRLRAAGLITLLVLYGTAVTQHDPGANLIRGLGLLVLLAAWMWLPHLGRTEALGCAALVAVAGVLSLPVASKLDADRPWWDYRSWDWFGPTKTVTFNWEHSYGPLDWPRDGTTLLNVKSDRAHYWKVETLDRFDGFRWLRSRSGDTTSASTALPSRLEPAGPTWDYYEYNPRWDERFRVTVRALRSEFVVGAGTPYDVTGAASVASTADGTTLKLGEPLERGDAYTVRTYAPAPNTAQLRGAPALYDPGLTPYTTLFLPRPGETAQRPAFGSGTSRSAAGAPDQVQIPLRGSGAELDPLSRRRLLESPYGPVYRLAQRLTAQAPTAYEAVRAIERHLAPGFSYSEEPRRHAHPLAAFLLEDRVGYCQQFSGAMALLLRMGGIPARVATGFSPGSYDPYDKEYRVRDLDAHSWVEVQFPGIGWVTFDPTPAAAPAERGASSGSPSDAAAAGAASRPFESGPAPRTPAGGGGSPAAERGGGPPLVGLAVGGLALLGVALLVVRRRRGPADPGDLLNARLRELEAAVRRLGWAVPGGTTLLALERRLARSAGPAAAGYAAALRATRYAPRAGAGPGPTERRRLRSELGATGGLRTRLRAWLALPPGGPMGLRRL